MKRWSGIFLLVLCFALSASAYAQGVPAFKGQVVQDEAGALTAAQTVELTTTLSGLSPEAYRVLIVKDAGGADMTDYLDLVWADWNLPGNAILLVVFSDSGNIRIHLGSELHRYGLSGESLVQAAREVFGPLAREGKLAEGVSSLATALNRQVLAGGGVATPTKPVSPPAQEQPTQPPAAEQPKPQESPQAPARPAAEPKSGTAGTWRTLSIATLGTAGVLAVFLLLTGRRRRRKRVRRM